jgi:Tol biopolymer transport system component
VLIVVVVQARSVEATSPGKPGKIAYSCDDGTNEAIYTIGASGGEDASKVLDNASEPSYSPSGKKIAFLGDTPADPAIYTIGVGGGSKVTDAGVADSEPSWGSK